MTEKRSPWLSPRAYIIRMPASMQREMHVSAQIKAKAEYDAYVTELTRKHPRKGDS